MNATLDIRGALDVPVKDLLIQIAKGSRTIPSIPDFFREDLLHIQKGETFLCTLHEDSLTTRLSDYVDWLYYRCMVFLSSHCGVDVSTLEACERNARDYRRIVTSGEILVCDDEEVELAVGNLIDLVEYLEDLMWREIRKIPEVSNVERVGASKPKFKIQLTMRKNYKIVYSEVPEDEE